MCDGLVYYTSVDEQHHAYSDWVTGRGGKGVLARPMDGFAGWSVSSVLLPVCRTGMLRGHSPCRDHLLTGNPIKNLQSS